LKLAGVARSYRHFLEGLLTTIQLLCVGSIYAIYTHAGDASIVKSIASHAEIPDHKDSED